MQYLSASLDERLDPARVLPTARCSGLGRVPLQQRRAGVRRRFSIGTSPSCRAMRGATTITTCCADGFAGSSRGWRRRRGRASRPSHPSTPVRSRGASLPSRPGIGWIGKHTCVINPRLGSWMLLGRGPHERSISIRTSRRSIVAARARDASTPVPPAPSPALRARRDAVHLVSHDRGPRLDRSGAAAGDRRQIVGCDICQDVCPWNRRALSRATNPAWQPRPGLSFSRLVDLCRLGDDEWRVLLRGSAMRRAGLRRIRRSQAYAAVHLPESRTPRRAGRAGGPPVGRGSRRRRRDPVEHREVIAWAIGVISGEIA